MLSGNCTEALSIQANVTISGASAKLIKNDSAPLPFPPRAAKAILVHKARGEGQGEGTCSILCNVRVHSSSNVAAHKRVMIETHTCAKCGAGVSVGILDGICGRCLAVLALGDAGSTSVQPI